MSKKLILSPSGVRGIVGESLTPEIVLHIAKAFGKYIGASPIVVAGDTRTSYELFYNAVVAGLTSIGIDVINIGQVPTPTCQHMIRHHFAKGGIVITASHNPIEWNGIKLMNAEGSFLTESEHQNFLSYYEKESFKTKLWHGIGTKMEDPYAIDKHIDKILAVINPQAIQKSNLRVLIDTNNGTGCLATPKLLNKLAIKYTLIGPNPNGIFSHTPEPNKKNLESLCQHMASGKYDIGFAQDPDADRLVIVAENGDYIGEDYSLAFCVDHILNQFVATPKQVVVNLSTSLIITDIAKKYGASIYHSKIGETHVTEKIRALNADVGGEGNGGVIFPQIGWGRDSLVGIVVALDYLARSKQSVSTIVSTYPKYAMVREKINIQDRSEAKPLIERIIRHFPEAHINKEDGVKLSFKDSWLQCRASNTEPIIRLFSEAPSLDSATALVKKALDLSQ